MTESEIQSLADSVGHMLISHASHGLATSSLDGTGEITLRDGLVVAAAAVAAKSKRAWILEREILPQGWNDANVDLMISRKGNVNLSMVGGIELKWWRRADAANAANRRRDLIKDFLRAAALYSEVEDVALVALLATTDSWSATTNTTGTDKTAMGKLVAAGTQQWNMTNMTKSKAVKNALKSLSGRVPVCNIFHSQLLTECTISLASNISASARIWSVRKPQKTKFLTKDEVKEMTKTKKKKKK